MNQEPDYQPFLVHIANKIRLSPHFTRIVFTGPELDHFADNGYGQHIKVMLPLRGMHADGMHTSGASDSGTYADGTSESGAHENETHAGAGESRSHNATPDSSLWGDPLLFDHDSIARAGWWDQWRALPEERRNVFRTYTIRRVEQQRREVCVDFVTHHGAGPAGTFAATAQVGDEAVLIGPNSRACHSADAITFHPGDASEIVLAGDETAVPAISSILESLAHSGWSGHAETFLEVPEAADALELEVPKTMSSMHWLARGRAQRGQRLLAAIPAYANEPQYAWIAAEADTTHALRRLLTSEMHMPKPAVTFYSYWRQGKPEL